MTNWRRGKRTLALVPVFSLCFAGIGTAQEAGKERTKETKQDRPARTPDVRREKDERDEARKPRTKRYAPVSPLFGPRMTLFTQSVALPSLFSVLGAPKTSQRAGDDAPDEIVGEPQTGAAGITETVAEIMAREARAGRQPVPPLREENEGIDFSRLPQDPDALPLSRWPFGGNGGGGIRLLSPQTVGNNFSGITTTGFVPPDSNGAVGTTQVGVTANGRIRFFTKAGSAAGQLSTGTDTFFQSVRNGSSISDPRIRFDRTTNRWFISAINIENTNNRIVLAVSSGPVITNSASFTFYFFNLQDGGGGTADNGGFGDYDTLGVDANAVYIGLNVFTSNVNATIFVIRKSSVTGGGPIVVTAFRNLISGNNGIFTPAGADNDDPTATQGYVFAVSSVALGRLVLRRVNTPGGTPTLATPVRFSVATYSEPLAVPAQGSTAPLDSLDLRLFALQVKKNRLTGTLSLWAAHNIAVGNTGVSSGTLDRTASRWYEIRNIVSGTPTVNQFGTLFDNAASNPRNYWIPSILMSGQGHAVLGSTVSGNTLQTRVVFAGRLGTDTLGQLGTPTLVPTTTGNYNLQSGVQRWGDYSFTALDPTDDMTFWTFQEYCPSNNNWAVQATQLLAVGPAAIASISPATISPGETKDIVVTGDGTGGKGFYDPDITGYPDPSIFSRLKAAFSGTGVTVHSVTFTSPTACTVNITVAANAAVGKRSLTITNPDGQAVSAADILTIADTAPAITALNPATGEAGSGDFTLTVNGSNFVAGSTVNFDGTARTTTFVNATQLTAAIPGSAILLVGNYPVTVTNPGGSTSNTLTFVIDKVRLSGTIALEGIVDSAPPQSVTVDFRTPGTQTVLFSRNVSISQTAPAGSFLLTGLTPGTYDLAVKGLKWLRRVVPSVNLSNSSVSGQNITLLAGDATNDNAVNFDDFQVLADAYFTTDGVDAAFDTAADFNCDGQVNFDDFQLLADNYFLDGDQ